MKSSKNKKRYWIIVTTFALTSLTGQKMTSQEVVLRTNEVKGETHISKEDFPKGNIINMVNGWGGMTVAINEPKAGTDFSPILKGLKDDLCQVPHWGYLEKGKIRIINSDKKTITVLAGEVFYMPPGHTLIVDEDARIIDFSPEKEMSELNTFVVNKVAEMQNKK
jgi:hypothetical protein